MNTFSLPFALALETPEEDAAIARLETALASGAPFEAILPDLESAGVEIDQRTAGKCHHRQLAVVGVADLYLGQRGAARLDRHHHVAELHRRR